MSKDQDHKVKEKLKKLLALAASDNEHEAALAMEKAQALMNEHNLSVRDVAEDGSGAVIKDEDVPGLTKSCQKWESSLGFRIAEAFDGRAIRTRSANGWCLRFIATKTDVEIIVDLFERLRSTVKRMSGGYVQTHRSLYPGTSAKTLHNNYRWGMVNTIKERLQQLKENTRPQESTNQYGLTGTDLIVIKNKAVDQRVTKLFPKIKKGKTVRLNYLPGAYAQGQKDGSTVNLHRAVGGNSIGRLPR